MSSGALEAASQPCWITPRDIQAGADWNGSILTAIEASADVVLLVSETSLASRFVQAEIQHAFDWKKKVVPVSLAEAEPARLDLRLKTAQQVQFSGDLAVVTRDLRTAFV